MHQRNRTCSTTGETNLDAVPLPDIELLPVRALRARPCSRRDANYRFHRCVAVVRVGLHVFQQVVALGLDYIEYFRLGDLDRGGRARRIGCGSIEAKRRGEKPGDR